MIRHHPSGELLSAYASGSLRAGAALVIACHVETCDACCREVSLLEGLGGLLLTRTEPVGLSEGAFERALKQLDANARPVRRERRLPGYLARFEIPQHLRGHEIGARRWLAPGIWFAPIDMETEASARTYLIWGAKNITLPRHTHAEREFTVVLHGAYRDDHGRFTHGDFAETDGETWHAPKVTPEQDCLCLLSSDGPMKLAAFSARLVQSFAGRQF